MNSYIGCYIHGVAPSKAIAALTKLTKGGNYVSKAKMRTHFGKLCKVSYSTRKGVVLASIFR